MQLPSFRFSTNGLRVFVGAVCVAVGAAVLAGLIVAGTPGDQRVRRMDQTRTDDLRSLRYAVDNYYADRKAVPEQLSDLEDPRYGAYRTVDPETGESYEYARVDATTFQLCAIFATDSSTDATDPRSPVPGDDQFAHGIGRTCFTFNAATANLGACGPNSSCPNGLECASLPGIGARCVAKDQLCKAAGCPDACTVAESFPVQVRCPSEPVSPTPGDASHSCALMTDPKTNNVGCFGCASGICASAPNGWQPFVREEGVIGIPYACYPDKDGCALAQ